MILTCRTFTQLIEDSREGRLSGFQRAKVRLHHAVCGMCQAYAKGIDTTVAALHELPEEPAPDSAKAAVLRRLREKRGG